MFVLVMMHDVIADIKNKKGYNGQRQNRRGDDYKGAHNMLIHIVLVIVIVLVMLMTINTTMTTTTNKLARAMTR